MSIEELSAQYNQIEQEPVVAEVEVIEAEETKTDDPPGYIGYEEWVGQGKDPDKFKGKKAYEDEYERIQKLKKQEDDLKSLTDVLKSTVEAANERERQIAENYKKELEKELARAKEDGDVDAALELKSKIDNTRQAEAPKQNPVISDFLSKNAILEDPEIKNEFARIYNGRLQADGVGLNTPLSDAVVQRYLASAMSSVKTLYADKFSSPKNDRTTPPKNPSTPKKTVDIAERLKQYRPDGLGPHNENAALGIYNMILKNSGPEKAKVYAERLLGEKL